MFRVGAYGLIVIGVIHLFVAGIEAAPYVGGWFSGALWTTEHWLPIALQSPGMVSSGLAFWSTLGSCAVPLVALGALLLWLDKLGHPVPRVLAFGLFAWAFTLAALMPPSGFLLIAAAALALSLGRTAAGGGRTHDRDCS